MLRSLCAIKLLQLFEVGFRTWACCGSSGLSRALSSGRSSLLLSYCVRWKCNRAILTLLKRSRWKISCKICRNWNAENQLVLDFGPFSFIWTLKLGRHFKGTLISILLLLQAPVDLRASHLLKSIIRKAWPWTILILSIPYKVINLTKMEMMIQFLSYSSPICISTITASLSIYLFLI